jgi:hypothetical protein
MRLHWALLLLIFACPDQRRHKPLRTIPAVDSLSLALPPSCGHPHVCLLLLLLPRAAAAGNAAAGACCS